jgi:hypothetical protein
VKPLVVGQIARRLLDLALDLVGLAIDLVLCSSFFASGAQLLQEAVRQPYRGPRPTAGFAVN